MDPTERLFYRVDIPKHDGPAFHICRYPVPAPRALPEFMIVPYGKPDAWCVGAFAGETLLLPEGVTGRRWPVLPAEISGLSPFWDEDSESPLLVPITVINDRRIDREWRAKALATPLSLGFAHDQEVLARVAWAVLCRADDESLIVALSRLSCFTDRFRWDATKSETLVWTMEPPISALGRLLANARAGTPLFHPRCVRWVLQEMLVVGEVERRFRANWQMSAEPEERAFGTAWFDCLRNGTKPSPGEIIRATWLLHDLFHGAGRDDEDDLGHRLATVTTALGYRFDTPGTWLELLDRYLHIWAIEDDHPALGPTPITPSELRNRYAAKLGIEPLAWLAGVWSMCVRWWTALDGSLSYSEAPDAVFSLPVEGRVLELDAAFRAAAHSHLVGSISDIRAGALREADGYSGLGSLPQHDALVFRNTPVIEMADGALVPLSVELIADRALALHRLLLGARGENATTFGHMFEAYVSDVLSRLKDRHLIVDEATLTGALGDGSRCDGLIVDGSDYVAVEASVQTLSRKVARGQLDAIEGMAERYQEEADQAIATIGQLPMLSEVLGLPIATSVTHLVVTESTIAHSPRFMQMLKERRPDRTEKFVCSIADLERLVELGLVGWSVPAAIRSWQSKAERTPLDLHLAEMARFLRPATRPHTDAEQWIQLLPVRRRPAA